MKFSLLLLLLAVPEVSVANSIFFNELGSGPLIDVNGLHTQGVLFGFVARPGILQRYDRYERECRMVNRSGSVGAHHRHTHICV